MKRAILIMAMAILAINASAGNDEGEVAAAEKAPKAKVEKKTIVKKGWNLGPLPVVAYDADKGFQYGAILQLFNYGDGSNYPNYNSKIYMEASFFTKGSQLYQLRYDNKTLIPGVRWSSALYVSLDKAFDFYGFNGYQSYYDFNRMDQGKAGNGFLYSPYYRLSRNLVSFKTDFIGKIGNNFHWEAGYHGSWHKIGSIHDNLASINKGKKEGQEFPENVLTLYDLYKAAGLISEAEAKGGYNSAIWAGLLYDTRDKEGAPTRGIWAEGHIMLSPKWLGSTNESYRYSFTWRHYLPIVKNDVLTFAYRINYEGTFGKNAPFYMLPFITDMGEGGDRDGFGGYRTVRGILRSRVWGLDTFTYTAEFRWRFVQFPLWNQNIALGLSAFSDGSMVTRGRNLDFPDIPGLKEGLCITNQKDGLHVTTGAGFRFIMNENFIVAAEYGLPISKFMKNSPIYRQDGDGAFYINIGYLF